MKKKTICLVISGMLAAGLVGCAGNGLSSSSVNLNDGYDEKQDADVSDTEQGTDTEDILLGAPDSDLRMSFEESYADFSADMLKRVTEAGENAMISPLSILAALTMTENGAAGETLTQMEQVLAGGIPVAQQNVDLTAYMKGLPDTEKCHMNQANSIWVKNSDGAFTVNEDFLQNNADTFEADIYSAPFDNQTLKDINTWVSNETDEMIPKMLDRIDKATVMFLINAMAFEAEWQETYESRQVWNMEFFRGDGTTETVEMMHSEESKYIEDADTTGFVKPYADGYSFVAMLPNEGISMETYLEGFTGEKYRNLMENCDTEATVNAGLPKFTSEYGIELKDILAEMGMPLAFDGEKADFSRLGAYENGNLYISMVLHKTYICVDELGTKAGAATVVAVDECAAAIPEEPKEVILNRPFVYAIVDNENNLPVFFGVVEKVEE